MPFYAVRSGIVPGVYLTWEEARKNVEGVKGAIHKKFSSASDAAAFIAVGGGCLQTRPSKYYVNSESSSSSSGSSSQSSGAADSNNLMDNTNSKSSSCHIPPSANTSSAPPSRKRSREGVSVNPSDFSSYNMVIYTDGACKGNKDVWANGCPAGWGAVVLSSQEEVIEELCGPVEIRSSHRNYLGAEVKSNNTAELTAIGESLRYIRDKAQDFMCTCEKTPCSCPRPKVTLRYDSEYAAKTVTGEFNGERNKELYSTIRHIYREVKYGGKYNNRSDLTGQRLPITLTFEKVKGHSKDKWNDRADALANDGAKLCVRDQYYVDEEERIRKEQSQ
jgi:ribonuclease HI